MFRFYEFFCGGGMVRAGLGSEWKCVFANDIDEKKAVSYVANWGKDRLKVCDVAAVETSSLPGVADLAWASFPCQDLSLAGSGAGLKGERSGTFWPFWRLMERLKNESRAPRLIVLENVYGTLTSHGGEDFTAIANALARGGYRFGGVVMDAVHFVPQSRPRLFIIGAHEAVSIPKWLIQKQDEKLWQPLAVKEAAGRLAGMASRQWQWWSLPAPSLRKTAFSELIEWEPTGVEWHSYEETHRLLRMMSPVNKAKLKAARESGHRMIGAVYKRTRKEANGKKVQRAEVRFDDIAGCLRTPVGGSSRQSIIVVDGQRVRSRLLSTREGARLMGLPDSYILPENYNEGYHLVGDGVVVPVVRFLSEQLLEPLLSFRKSKKCKAA